MMTIASFHAQLSALLWLFSLLTALSLGADTISINESLSGSETLVSPGGHFELGFFRPGNSFHYYIGIWYKKIPGQTIIWVANRDKPVSDSYSSKLKISNDGNLVLITNESQPPVWSTNLTPNTCKSVEALLLDDGNLVLKDASNSGSPLLWESFDHPTDTLVPGAKLGLGKKEKWRRALTSWKNSEDPATGLYTIERDPNASQITVLWNLTEVYWSSGLWEPDQQIFSRAPELKLWCPGIYCYKYVDNENESYVTFSVARSLLRARFVMHASGQMQMLSWSESTQQWVLVWAGPEQQCEVYAYCGAFGICNPNSLPYCHCLEGFEPNSMNEWNLKDYSAGCGRKIKLKCEMHKNNTNGDKFLVSHNMVLPQNPQLVSASSAKECDFSCLRRCSCTAYVYDSNTCSIWFGDLLNMTQLAEYDTSGGTLHIRLAASEMKTSHRGSIFRFSVGLVMGLIAVLGLVYFVYWRMKRRSVMVMDCSLTRFGYSFLQSSTKNFSEKLGEGGFGSVFKGTLPDSTVIAVKKLKSIGQSSQGEKQFRAEVSAIGTIQHVNLVRLRGFCSEGTKRLLGYDYMLNGSLDIHLFRRNNSSRILTWKKRYQIAIGIARGLAYLHEKCRDCIIHCDIKPENILLDAEFCPKISDFGLAKFLGREFSRVLTTIRGTRGYLAPEWISGLAITPKADVYSYGMMLFELVSGKRNIQQSSDGLVEFFPIWAVTKLMEGEDVLMIVDPRLEGNAERDEVMSMCKLACWCIQDEETKRPTMGQALQVLEGLMDVDLPLLPQSLQMFAVDEESIMFFGEYSSSQELMERTIYESATSSHTPSMCVSSSSQVSVN